MSKKRADLIVIAFIISILGMLAANLITFKVLGLLHSSWLWVLAPLWIPLVLVLGLVFFSHTILIWLDS
jgi:sterol desaturase/sphingolipid hydroxylase (fatty acid hydroxylase superfamily)